MPCCTCIRDADDSTAGCGCIGTWSQTECDCTMHDCYQTSIREVSTVRPGMRCPPVFACLMTCAVSTVHSYTRSGRLLVVRCCRYALCSVTTWACVSRGGIVLEAWRFLFCGAAWSLPVLVRLWVVINLFPTVLLPANLLTGGHTNSTWQPPLARVRAQAGPLLLFFSFHDIGSHLVRRKHIIALRRYAAH